MALETQRAKGTAILFDNCWAEDIVLDIKSEAAERCVGNTRVVFTATVRFRLAPNLLIISNIETNAAVPFLVKTEVK